MEMRAKKFLTIDKLFLLSTRNANKNKVNVINFTDFAREEGGQVIEIDRLIWKDRRATRVVNTCENKWLNVILPVLSSCFPEAKQKNSGSSRSVRKAERERKKRAEGSK